MRRTEKGGKGTALRNSTYRRDSNGSHDQGRFGIYGAGGGVSAAAIATCTRQHEARQHETRRNEARQDARRQNDARREGQDVGDGEVPWQGARHFGTRDGLSRGGWQVGAAADQFQD